MKRGAEALGLLGQHPLFEGLGAELHHAVLTRATEIHLDPGSTLYVSGGAATSVFVILKGAIQIEYPPKGEPRGPVVALVAAPSFLGESQVLRSQPWSGTGVAVAQLLSLGIRKNDFVNLLGEHAVLTRRFYLELASRFFDHIETWRHHPQRSPAVTLARYLTGLHEVQGARRRLDITQADLGRALGLRRETVNRLLKRWAAEGWVRLEASGIELLTPKAVKALGEEVPGAELVQRCVLPDPSLR